MQRVMLSWLKAGTLGFAIVGAVAIVQVQRTLAEVPAPREAVILICVDDGPGGSLRLERASPPDAVWEKQDCAGAVTELMNASFRIVAGGSDVALGPDGAMHVVYTLKRRRRTVR